MRPTDCGILLSARSRSPSRLLHSRRSWLSNTGTPDNCLRPGWSDSPSGSPPARAESITSAQQTPTPRQARALAFAGMISIAYSFRIAVPAPPLAHAAPKRTDLTIFDLTPIRADGGAVPLTVRKTPLNGGERRSGGASGHCQSARELYWWPSARWRCSRFSWP
jgi:hypothetical protein